MLIHTTLLISTSLLYAIPFYMPATWPLLFLFLPTLYLLKRPMPFFSCFLFGLTLFSVLLLPIFHALFLMAQTLYPIITIALYASLFPAIWIWLSFRYLPSSLTLWTISCWIYFMIIDRLMLSPCGIIEGYFFTHPLIVMPDCIQLLTTITSLPLVLLYYCTISACITQWLRHRNAYNLMIILLCITPSIIPLLYAPLIPTLPPWLARIHPLPIKIPLQSPHAMIAALDYHAPNSQSIMILPESAWPSDASCLHQWPNRPAHLIIGGFKCYTSNRANRLYWIHEKSIDFFDKKHALPMVERSIIPWIDAYYFTQYSPSITSRNPRPLWHLTEQCDLVPYICSELFFNHTPDDVHPHATILACANDWWFKMPHFQKLMARAARLRAMQWQRPIIFISYHTAAYFDVFGNTTNLPISP